MTFLPFPQSQSDPQPPLAASPSISVPSVFTRPGPGADIELIFAKVHFGIVKADAGFTKVTGCL